jgi:DNA-binding SARP family transcriptional activator
MNDSDSVSDNAFGQASSAGARAAFDLGLIGAFALSQDGDGVGLPAGAQHVVALLAIRGRTTPRKVIAGILWPDAPEENALGSLRSLLGRLDPSLREELGVTVTDLTLAPEVAVDLERARAVAHPLLTQNVQVTDEDLGQASIVLLSADLLPDWDEDWLRSDSQQWHELRVHALESLSGRLRELGRFGLAIEAALAAIEAEPLRENGYAALVRVYLAEGDDEGASKAVARYRTILREELQTRPSASFERLFSDSARRAEASVIRRARTAMAGEETSEFEVVASGISMEPSIRHGDTLMVSPDVPLAPGRVVVAIHNDVWIVKRIAIRDGALVLRSDNVDEEVALADVSIQGVVVQLLRTI